MDEPIIKLILSYKYIYFIISLIFSLYYSLCAEMIFWTKEQRDNYHKDYSLIKRFHQIWLNFVGSALGWFSLYLFFYVVQNVEVKEISFADILLLIIGLLGIIGWLPMTLFGVGQSLVTAVKRLIDKIA